jgi:translation initiation factor IF-1
VKEPYEKFFGTVITHHRNAHFRVRLGSGRIIKARCGGRVNTHKIKIFVGDSAIVALTRYDPDRGRIIFRA